MCGGGDTNDLDSKKPEDTDFRQQRLRAWQPLLTPAWVIGTFFFIGLIFLPIGAVIMSESDSVVEQELIYSTTCGDVKTTATCDVTFTIEKEMKAPVYLYYKLTNYYQNHRRYVKSKDDKQLRGADKSTWDTSTCDPLITSGTKGLYPCGLMANSFFNDVFKGYYDGSSTALTGTEWDKSDIAWKSDVDYKYKDLYTTAQLPSDLTRNSTLIATGTARTPAVLPYINDQDFIVWMRNAGLPTFRKLYRKIDKTLAAGKKLKITIENNYDVASFSGSKYLVLSTSSWLGGKNNFLGYAYIVVGALCMLVAILFAIKHFMCGRPLGDMKYFSLNFGKK